MKARDIGDHGEKIAKKYLRKKGYKILASNQHESHNELDLIACDASYIVFVEVKTRTTDETLYSRFGTPASAVDFQKRKRLITAAKDYLSRNNQQNKQPRFDVVEVYLMKDTFQVLHINHIENAFTK